MKKDRIEYRVEGKQIKFGSYMWQFTGVLAEANTETDARRIVEELNLLQREVDEN